MGKNDGGNGRTKQSIQRLERAKRVANAVLMPPLPIAILSVPVTAALMIWAFALGGSDTPLSGAAYAVSAYALTIVVARIVYSAPLRRLNELARRNRRIERLLDDQDHRTVMTTYLSLGIDAPWVVVNLAAGAVLGSAWFITLAAYYLLHAAMRAALLHSVHRQGVSDHYRRELCAARTCGILIASSIIVVAGIVVLIVHGEGGFSYPGTLIYAVALYTFWALATSIINYVRYRKHDSPALFAVMAANLATALVSLFMLEVAMLAAFSPAGEEAFTTTVTSLTGATVALLVLVMGTHLAVRSSRALRKDVQG